MKEKISKNIVATITYFDVFDYPMTSYEVFTYCIDSERLLGGSDEGRRNINFFSIVHTLEELTKEKTLDFFQGYYFLPGREKLAKQRRVRSKVSEQKLKKVKRLFWIFRFFPFVRMVGVTGTLSMKNITRESDWDVFIVLKKGCIWMGRTLVTIMLHALGKRRHGDKEKDRVCLNHFVTDASLEIAVKDIFSAREYAFMSPLVGEKTYNTFEIKNKWIQKVMPNWMPAYEPSLLLMRESSFSRKMQSFFEKAVYIPRVEIWLKKWQTQKIQDNPKTQIPGGYIQANDEGLIFLPKPQGPKTFEEFKKRLRENK